MDHSDNEVEEEGRSVTNVDLTDVARYWSVTLTERNGSEDDELLALCYLALYEIVRRDWKMDDWDMTNVTNLNTKDH